MNKNKIKINKKKLGVHSPALILFLILMVIGFEFMLIIFAKMSSINIEAIRSEAEAGNELIRIYIYIDEVYETSNTTITTTTTSGTATQTITTNTTIPIKKERTRITITNQWGKTSVIDYFVIEDWNGRIISRGEFNPPIILGAGEQRDFKGNEILETFKLNNSLYAEDFWFFKSKIRCITLHTIFGNTFGSAYKPLRIVTQAFEYYVVSIIEAPITINQTFATTFYGSYTLKIESHGPFNIPPRDDNPKWYKIREKDDRVEYHDVWGDGIQPNSDPYGRRYDDGEYVYPAGILLTISHSFRSFPCSWLYDRVYVTNGYNYIGPYGHIFMYVTKMELWELDQFGNEVRKILETTSNSISFAMLGNYKLKRYFGYSTTPYNPPITTVTYTATATATTETPRKIREGTLEFTVSKQDPYTKKSSGTGSYTTKTPNYYIVHVDKYRLEGDAQYIEGDPTVHIDPETGFTKTLSADATIKWKAGTPVGAQVKVIVPYEEWYIPPWWPW
ncbi:MAG: hypothetical protein QW272_09100 [Candidatus Methanomethylicaceae archaeon]